MADGILDCSCNQGIARFPGKLPSPDGGGKACEQDVPLPVAEIVQEWVIFEPNGRTERLPVTE